jgi:hypothetical protein
MSAATLVETLPLGGWQNFYVIIGSSAAALTGLTFIVITLVADANSASQAPSTRLLGLRAFITPTTVHFVSALWLSALLTIPGHTVNSLALCLAATGLVGVVYCVRVIRWMIQTLAVYKVFLSDWIWCAALPLLAHLGLLGAALLLAENPRAALYAVAGATLLVLLTGIHNAWDVVAWVTTERHAHREKEQQVEAPGHQDPHAQSDAPRGRGRS